MARHGGTTISCTTGNIGQQTGALGAADGQGMIFAFEVQRGFLTMITGIQFALPTDMYSDAYNNGIRREILEWQIE